MGFCLSTSVSNKFLWTRDEFEKNGVDHKDLKGKDERVYANKMSLNRFLTATGKIKVYDQAINIYTQSDEKYKTIKNTADWIIKKREDIFLIPGHIIKAILMRNLPYENGKIPYETIRVPKRYFYNETTGTGLFNEQLKRLKPYSFEVFENQLIIIGVLCPKEHEGTIEGFINLLEKRLKEDFHIKLKFKFVFINNEHPDSYKNGVYSEDLKNSSLVIVILNEHHKSIPIKYSPYFVCKAKLLGWGIPTQEDSEIKNIRNPNTYTLNNISLNIYAKLGGTPWTIEREEKRKDELIIGIGSTTDLMGKPMLGLAQIFHSNGKYLVGNCVPLTGFEDYTEKLASFLIQSLDQLLNDGIISTEREFRIIFHLFKSPSYKYEIQAINKLISKFQNCTFKYSLIHIGYGHNFHIFNNEGKQQNEKGLFIVLDKNMALLNFVTDGTKPLLLTVDRRSIVDFDLGFNDLYYLSKQIYWFSHLSYKSYLAAKKPITLSYPSIMARLTEQLKEVEGWDFEYLERIGEKLWFI